jgi:HK97 family phage major capsid protein
MNTLKVARGRAAELTAEIAQIKRDRAAIGDGAIEGNRALTTDERSRFTAYGRKIDGLEKDLAANAIELAAGEQRDEDVRNYRGPLLDDPDAAASARANARAGFPTGGYGSGTSGPARPAGRKFADLFAQVAGQTDGWAPGEYLHVIGHGLHDQRLRADSQSGSVPSAGGFAVPGQLLGILLDSSLESEIVRSRCITWPMTTSELDVPALDDLDRSGGDIAGLTLQFTAELGIMIPQVAKLRALKLRARKGSLFVESSNELLQDAPNFESNLTAALIKVLSFGLDANFLFGTGAAGPLGALVSPAAIKVVRTAAGDIQYETDILTMFSRLTSASVSRAVWLASPSCIPKLGALSINIGAGGSHIPALTSPGGQWTLLTRPMIFSEKMKVLGTEADLALCDFGAYAIGMRREASLDKSAHVGFAKDVETYRLIVRCDGQPTLSGPVTPLNGPTLSPFVVLQ